MAQRTCPNCGMQQSEWLATEGEGFNLDGQTYCCRGCAEGSGCTCRQANPGDLPAHRDPEGEASALMTPRDKDGRPLEPGEDPRHARQLVESAGTSRPRSTEEGPERSREAESR